MATKKVFVKKAKPTSWYFDQIGKSIVVHEEPHMVGDKLVYEYVDIPNYAVFEDDILSNENLRDRKLKRIINN